MWTTSLRRRKKILSFKEPVNLQEQIKESSKICICMPRDNSRFYEAREVLHKIKNHDHWVMLILEKELELLAEHSGKTEVYPPAGSKPFPLTEEMLRHIPKNFDIAIDLSPQPTPTTAYITGTRGKKMTIGLKSGELDPFYTVLVNPHDDYKTSVITMLNIAGFVLREE
jgi:hypothetical protein